MDARQCQPEGTVVRQKPVELSLSRGEFGIMSNIDRTQLHASTQPPTADTLPPARYARLCRLGQGDLEAFLAVVGDLSAEDFTAVLCSDLQYQWQAGNHVPAEEYVHRLPHQSSEAAADLVFQEYLVRERLGETPTAEELTSRFPELATIIRDQIGLHEALATLGNHPNNSSSRTHPGVPRVTGDPAEIGESIGDFEVLEELARGGMGIVYRARQKSLNRIVALKMILAGQFAASDEVRRFQFEAEAVARLDHPNILPIFEVNHQRGRHYFAMKFVEGGNLSSAAPRLLNQPKAAVEILVKVCRAVHFAHQRGILHRDLKPVNVLLDRDDRPYVSDFGLAKWVDRGDGDTASGSVIGTPAYMAPEQASASSQLTIAADTYSLGAILYELLTGQPPFRSESVLATLRLVQDVDPVAPREVRPAVDRDLETIALKCLDKDPNRRYGSAEALADELDRWLHDEPITARPATIWERTRKWIRRRPAIAGLAAVLLVVVVSSIVSLAVLYAKAEDRRRDAESARASAERERDQVREQRRRTRQALDDMLSKEGLTWLTTQPDLSMQQRAFLGRALKYYEEFAVEERANPEARADLAEAKFRIAYINGALGRLPQAESALRQSLDILEELGHAPSSSVERRAHLASGYMNLSNLLAQTGRLPDAAIAAQRAIAIRKQLILDQPAVVEHARSLASVQSNLGVIFARLSQWSEAEGAFRSAISVQERLAATHPQVPEYQAQAAGSHHNLARLLAKTGRMVEAEAEARRSLEACRKLTDANSDVPAYAADLARSYINLGQLFAEQRRPLESEAEYRAGIEIQEKLAKQYGAVPERRAELATSRHDLAMLLHKLDRFADAEKEYRKELTLRERLVADAPTDADASLLLSQSHNALGVLYTNLARNSEAEMAYRAAISIQEKLVADHGGAPELRQQLAITRSNLGDLLTGLNRHSEAESLLRASIKVKQSLVAEFPELDSYARDLANAQDNLGLLLAKIDQWRESESQYRSAIASRQKGLRGEASDPEYWHEQAQTWNNLGVLLQAQNRRSDAMAAFQTAFEIRTRLAREFPGNSEYAIDLATICCSLANNLSAGGEYNDALTMYDRSIASLESMLTHMPANRSTREGLRVAYWGRSKCLAHLGRVADALRDCDRSVQLADESSKDRFRLNRALILARTPRYAEATADAESLVGSAAATSSDLYDGACVIALAAVSAENESDISDRFCIRSVQLLRRLGSIKELNPSRLVFDNDLTVLRNRPDFMDLMWDIALTSPAVPH